MRLGWFRGQITREPGAWCMDGKCLRYDITKEAWQHCGLTPLALCWVAMNTEVKVMRRKDGRYQV